MLLLLWCTLSVCVLAAASRAEEAAPTATPVPTPLPLEMIVDDMQGAPLDVVKLAAAQQAEADGPRFRSAPASVPFHQSFEGDFEPLDAQTRLAIFSDDGCDVWIDGVQVLARKDTGQALPILDESLHALDFTPQSGRSYHIKVDYSNTIYAGDTDVDGVTLFAYTFDPTSSQEPDIALRFSKSVFTPGESTRAEVEVSGPESLLGQTVMVALDGPGTMAPQRFPMSVGSTRFVQVTMPTQQGDYTFRARIEGQSALDEAAVGVSVMQVRDGSDWSLYEARPRSGEVALWWETYPFAMDGAATYRVFWSADNGTAGTFDVDGGQTRATHSGLSNGVTYEYYVRALLGDDRHESVQRTNTVHATPQADAPATPQNLTATGRPDGSVRLEWTASTTPGVEKYWLYRGTQQGVYDFIGSVVAPGTSSIDYGLSEGTYWYVVEAMKNNVGSGQSSPAWVQLVKPSVPATPLSFSAEGLDRKVSLAWGESANANTFHIRRRAQGQTGWTQWDVPGSVHAYDDTDNGAGLSNGVRYEYELYGVNWGGASSAVGASATPHGGLARERPSTPTFATAVAGDGYVKVTWGESLRANHYAIKRLIVASETRFWDQKTQIASDPRTFIDRNVLNGKAYQYQVVAINESGDSEPATTAQVTPAAQVQPDGLIRVEGESGFSTASSTSEARDAATRDNSTSSGYSGDNIYNTVGTKQFRELSVARDTAAVYFTLVQNDGKVSDTIKVTAPAGAGGWIMHYFDMAQGTEVTNAVTGAGYPVRLPVVATRELGVKVIPTSSVPLGQALDTLVRSTSQANSKAVDVVLARTRATDFSITSAKVVQINGQAVPADWDGRVFRAKQGGRTVKVEAVTSVRAAGLTVHWSFSDPDQDAGHVPNQTDGKGDDNSGTGAGLGGAATFTSRTDATGKAYATFTLSSYGGDNYNVRAAKSATGTGTKTTPTFTVWKRVLFEETDALPGYTNDFSLITDKLAQVYVVLYQSKDTGDTINPNDPEFTHNGAYGPDSIQNEYTLARRYNQPTPLTPPYGLSDWQSIAVRANSQSKNMIGNPVKEPYSPATTYNFGTVPTADGGRMLDVNNPGDLSIAEHNADDVIIANTEDSSRSVTFWHDEIAVHAMFYGLTKEQYMRYVLLHEVAHVLGLQHSDADPEDQRLGVMSSPVLIQDTTFEGQTVLAQRWVESNRSTIRNSRWGNGEATKVRGGYGG